MIIKGSRTDLLYDTVGLVRLAGQVRRRRPADEVFQIMASKVEGGCIGRQDVQLGAVERLLRWARREFQMPAKADFC